METPSQVIEITLISGEDLFTSRNQRVKRNAFAIVKTDASNSQRTREDKDGGSNPAWNETLEMNLSNHARSIVVEVHCKSSSGNKVVGVANIPTSDFVGGYAGQGCLHFLSYRLRDQNGERNGIINVSVRVKMSSGWTGVGVPVDGKMSSGIVTGFPVGYNYKS